MSATWSSHSQNYLIYVQNLHLTISSRKKLRSHSHPTMTDHFQIILSHWDIAIPYTSKLNQNSFTYFRTYSRLRTISISISCESFHFCESSHFCESFHFCELIYFCEPFHLCEPFHSYGPIQSFEPIHKGGIPIISGAPKIIMYTEKRPYRIEHISKEFLRIFYRADSEHSPASMERMSW